MEKARKNRVWKRVKKSALALVVLLIVGWLLAYQYARPLIETKIINAFARATSSRYTLTFDDLYISYYESGITIKNLRISPKPDSLQALEKTSLLELSCANVSVRNINLWKTFFSKDFAADNLELENPNLTVWNNGEIKSENKDSIRHRDLRNLRLENIRIKNAQAVIKNKKDNRLLFETKHLNVFIEDFGLTADLVPLYSHFSLESSNNSLGIFPNQLFKLEKLFLAGNANYTGLNASGFDISEIDSSIRKALKIPDEITFSLDGISLESESLSSLIDNIVKANTQQINISRLLLIHPQVAIETKRNKDEATLDASEKLKQVSKKLSLPIVDKVGILEGEFVWKEPGEQNPVLQISKINIVASGLKPRFGEKIPLLYSTAEINTGNITFTYPKSQYTLYADHAQYRSVTDSLKIIRFKVLPHKSIDSFYVDKKWREDRFEFTCDTIYFEHLNLSHFAFTDQFSPKYILFKKPEIKAYTDKRLNHDPSFTKPFPLQRLREIEGDFDIGKIAFQNGKITYSEKVLDSPGLGTLKISEANLEISNIKNKVDITDTSHIYFNCTLGAGSFAEMYVDIPLNGTDEIQFGRGMIKNLPFKQLNSITENTVYMGFGDGKLDSCWFNFKAVNGNSEGNSVFLYNNLRVKIYKLMDVPAYKTKVLMNKGFMSIVANLLINKNNPNEKGYSLPGKIAFERDKLKGPLNFWIKSVMTGLMNTVIDDISELKDLQSEIKSLKSSSQTGLLSKMKSNPIQKNIRKQARDAKKAFKSAGGTK